jgi:hypothetical protein
MGGTIMASRCLARLAAAWLACALAACDDSNPVDSGSAPDLTNPAIAPRVVSTYPADGGRGPFKLYVPGQDAPHFVLQLNKLIRLADFQPAWIHIEGFGVPVEVRPLPSPFRIPPDAPASDRLDHILEMAVYDLPYRPIAYAVGVTYTVTVGTGLEDLTGRHPAQVHRFSYTPEPHFRVTDGSPEDGAQRFFPQETPYLAFNSPVDSTLFGSLRLSPPHPGGWRLSPYQPNTVIFQHLEPFPFATAYELQVLNTAADVHGNRVQAASSTSWRVVPFEIASTSPAAGATNVHPLSGLYVYATGPLDTASVRTAFAIQPAVDGLLAHQANSFFFDPNAELATGTHYEVTIGASLRAYDGTALAAPYVFGFTTEDFRITVASPGDGSTEVGRHALVTVWCNVAYDPATAAAAFSISPNVAGELSTAAQSNQFSFQPQQALAPYTTYTVTVSTALRSSRGAALAAPFTAQFRTAGP